MLRSSYGIEGGVCDVRVAPDVWALGMLTAALGRGELRRPLGRPRCDRR